MAEIVAHKGDSVLALALARGATVRDAAREADVSERTAFRRLGDSAFCREVHRLRGEMIDRAAGALAAAATEAVEVICELADKAKDEAVRLRAAKAVLEVGGRLRQLTELESRLKELEDRLYGRTTGTATGSAGGNGRSA